MNTQALQKKIIDGRLQQKATIGDWVGDEFRNAPANGTAEDLCAMDAQEREYLTLFVAGQGMNSWASPPRFRQR